jgi:hypothetical protein
MDPVTIPRVWIIGVLAVCKIGRITVVFSPLRELVHRQASTVAVTRAIYASTARHVFTRLTKEGGVAIANAL